MTIFYEWISKQISWPFLGIRNKMLQYQFVKCFAFINVRKQEVLTGVKNTGSSCLITQSYFQFYIQLAAFPLCT